MVNKSSRRQKPGTQAANTEAERRKKAKELNANLGMSAVDLCYQALLIKQ